MQKLKIIGIIMELNPLHYGHQYLIDEIKKQHPDALIVVITSGYFTMRGEISLLDKVVKTQELLKLGCDIIIELPTFLALNASSDFAYNSIKLLNKLNITHLAFGIEPWGYEYLDKILAIEESLKWQKHILTYLPKLSYKQAYYKTFLDLTNDQELASKAILPNMTLALSYLKCLKTYPHITPLIIKRIGQSDESQDLTENPSGTALRMAIYKNINVSSYLPYDYSLLNKNIDFNALSTLIKSLKINYSPNQTFHNHLITEGIDNYIINNLNLNLEYPALIDQLANKKYSKSRIQRTLLSMILNNQDETEDFIRILGFSCKGETILKTIKTPYLFSSLKDAPKIYQENELKATYL